MTTEIQLLESGGEGKGGIKKEAKKRRVTGGLPGRQKRKGGRGAKKKIVYQSRGDKGERPEEKRPPAQNNSRKNNWSATTRHPTFTGFKATNSPPEMSRKRGAVSKFPTW